MSHWKEIFDQSHESKMQERRRSLMALNRVTVSDIEVTMLKQQAPAQDVITLDSSDEDNGNKSAAGDGQNNISSGNNAKKPVMEKSTEDASLLSTLRLLASLDSGTKQTEFFFFNNVQYGKSGGSLGDGLGIRLGQLKDAALTLEAGQFGSSEGLVRERECCNLLDQVGIILFFPYSRPYVCVSV